jgi:hypothetical protein
VRQHQLECLAGEWYSSFGTWIGVMLVLTYWYSAPGAIYGLLSYFISVSSLIVKTLP